MQLKPQDVLVALKFVSCHGQSWTYAQLAVALDMSPSQVHAAVKRGIAVELIAQFNGGAQPQWRNLAEFLVHGLRYVFVAERGEMTRGIPTAYAAPPLNDLLQAGAGPPPVWPHGDGDVRGVAFSPLFRSAPEAARQDCMLYELLALVDGIRGGRTRERQLASQELNRRLEARHSSA